MDGLILVPTEKSQQQIKMLQKWGVPFVLLDRYFPEVPVNHIALNNYKAAYDGTTHLIKQGHQHIAFSIIKPAFITYSSVTRVTWMRLKIMI
ncbi:hypothetical protein [Mucilaginibacter antarcticus]|uniref:hypothetical protein n=1 Tax=Mucilaginibacter antarcticus TaxID=1855725 RepID=UPI0036357CE7